MQKQIIKNFRVSLVNSWFRNGCDKVNISVCQNPEQITKNLNSLTPTMQKIFLYELTGWEWKFNYFTAASEINEITYEPCIRFRIKEND